VLPATVATTPTVQLLAPGCGASVQDDDELEKNVAALPVKATVPVGGEVDAESATVAVQLLGLPGSTGEGMQLTEVCVGSINESTATPVGPPGSLMKLGRSSVTPLGPISARPIALSL
jgi:hypothetical protein